MRAVKAAKICFNVCVWLCVGYNLILFFICQFFLANCFWVVTLCVAVCVVSGVCMCDVWCVYRFSEFFFLCDPIGYSDRIGFYPIRSLPDRVCNFSPVRVSITTRTDPNPKFFGSGRIGSGILPTPRSGYGTIAFVFCVSFVVNLHWTSFTHFI